jgi:aryl-phospho-beta-D-glucosidase BglC (GH1 family)
MEEGAVPRRKTFPLISLVLSVTIAAGLVLAGNRSGLSARGVRSAVDGRMGDPGRLIREEKTSQPKPITAAPGGRTPAGVRGSAPRAARPHAGLGATDFLKASGTVLRNRSGKGAVVALHGTNLGGWLLQEGWMSPLGEAALDRTGWAASASSTAAGGSPANALDGTKGTRWSTGAAQVSGQWFMVDMRTPMTFNQVSFDAGPGMGDYPASYTLQASNDNTYWWTIASGVGNGQDTVAQTTFQTARYIKITQGGNKGNWWSIAAFNVYVSDEFSVRQTLTNRFGAATADRLFAGYHDAWIQVSDLDRIKATGLNLVRVPIYWQLLMKPDGIMKPDSQAFRELDWVVGQSARRGLYVILDLHGTPGAACPWQSCGQAGTDHLWTDATDRRWTIALWQRLATHYAGNPAVAGYDLLNEPLVTNGAGESAAQAQQVITFYNTLYHAVRASDPNHVIIIEAFPGWAQAVPPWTYRWTNVLYELHYYDMGNQYNWNAQNNLINTALRGIATYQAQWHVPVYAGEFWFGQFTDLYGKFLSGLSALHASWSNWAYKNKNTNTAIGPDGLQQGGNWGFYNSDTQPTPNINTDSAAAIASAWSKFTTSYFQPNAALQHIFSAYSVTNSPASPRQQGAHA